MLYTYACEQYLEYGMKLTCITTVFNEGDALLVNVASILNQTYQNFEYIIIDDGSSDNSLDILKTIKDPRIKIIEQANDGVSSARNRAIEHVTGDYVCFLDADDCRPNWAFQMIIDAIETHDPDLLLCSGILSEVRGEMLPFYDSKFFDMLSDLCPSGSVYTSEATAKWAWPLAQLIEPQPANKVVRTSMLKQQGIGFPNTHFFEDIYFHTLVVAAAKRIAFVRSPCFTYFRRYARPQTTAATGDIRFDIIAVTKLTLESFTRYTHFHDPVYRSCVITSCVKLMEWCENSISHQHRHHFHQTAQGFVRLIDQKYLNFPSNLPVNFKELEGARRYLKKLSNAA